MMTLLGESMPMGLGYHIAAHISASALKKNGTFSKNFNLEKEIIQL